MTEAFFVHLAPGQAVRVLVPTGMSTRQDSTASRTPILLIHGAGMSAESWDQVIEPLGAALPTYAIDLPGHGESFTPDADWQFDFGAFIANVCQLLECTRVHLVGNSLGALVALEAAATNPRLTEKLVLVGIAGSTAEERAQRQQDMERRMSEPGGPPSVSLDQVMAQFVKPSRELTEQVRASLERSEAYRAVIRRMVGGHDTAATAASVRCPTLIMCGRGDPLLARTDAFRQAFPNAESVIVEGAGHFPQKDEPAAFVQAVLDFILR